MLYVIANFPADRYYFDGPSIFFSVSFNRTKTNNSNNIIITFCVCTLNTHHVRTCTTKYVPIAASCLKIGVLLHLSQS